MSIGQTMETFLSGLKNMVPPIAILALAWSLATVTNELHTADFLSNLINDSIDAKLLPVIIFILAAFISFSTGSSWGTMAILYPIALPLTWTMGWTSGLDINAIMELIVPIISFVNSINQAIYNFDGFHWGLILYSAENLNLGKIFYKEIFSLYGIFTTLLHALILKKDCRI